MPCFPNTISLAPVTPCCERAAAKSPLLGGMQRARIRIIMNKCPETSRLSTSIPHGMHHGSMIETHHTTSCHRRCDRSHRTRCMPPPVMRCAKTLAYPNTSFIASHCSGYQVTTATILFLGKSQNDRKNHGTRVQYRSIVQVILFDNISCRCIDHCCSEGRTAGSSSQYIAGSLAGSYTVDDTLEA